MFHIIGSRIFFKQVVTVSVLLLLVSLAFHNRQNGEPSIRQMGSRSSELSPVGAVPTSPEACRQWRDGSLCGRGVGGVVHQTPHFRTRSAFSKQRLQLSVPRTSQGAGIDPRRSSSRGQLVLHHHPMSLLRKTKRRSSGWKRCSKRLEIQRSRRCQRTSSRGPNPGVSGIHHFVEQHPVRLEAPRQQPEPGGDKIEMAHPSSFTQMRRVATRVWCWTTFHLCPTTCKMWKGG